MQGTGRGLDGIGVGSRSAHGRHYQRIDTGTLAGAGYGAKVAHIGNTVEQHQQRRATLLVEQRHNILDVLIFYRCGKCHHTLMILLSQSVEFLLRHTLHRNRADT